MGVQKVFEGQKYGRLTVIKEIEPHISPSGAKSSRFLCRCECGNETTALSSNLRRGLKKSCGCLEKENHIKPTHGKTHTRLFSIWVGMRRRCYDIRRNNYKNYGAKGIRVCDEWLGENGFQNFYDWAMANGYDDTLTIDRVSSSANYEPSNCRWVDMKTQQNNRWNNHRVSVKGEELTISQVADKYHLNYNVLVNRINRGKDAEQVVSDLLKAK